MKYGFFRGSRRALVRKSISPLSHAVRWPSTISGTPCAADVRVKYAVRYLTAEQSPQNSTTREHGRVPAAYRGA